MIASQNQLDHLNSLGLHYRGEAAKLYKKFLTFGFILLTAHLLDLKPQRYQGFGLSVDIKDQKILYGFLACIVLYEFCMAFYYEIIGNSILFFNFFDLIKTKIAESLKKDNPDWSEAKINSRSSIYSNLSFVVMLPFMLSILFIGLLSLIVASRDLYYFIILVINKYEPMIWIFLDGQPT